MHLFKALSASCALVTLASCSDNIDLSQRDWLQPVNPESLDKRQAGDKVVQIVQVGDNNGSLKFFPENIVAEPGSVVQFQFYPKVHTLQARPQAHTNHSIEPHNNRIIIRSTMRPNRLESHHAPTTRSKVRIRARERRHTISTNIQYDSERHEANVDLLRAGTALSERYGHGH